MEIKKEHLIGSIKNFPVQVVRKMVEYQVAQDNKADISIFQKSADSRKDIGGFDWYKTPEGTNFWSVIINFNKFDTFFDMYPAIPVIDEQEVPGKDKKDVDIDFIKTPAEDLGTNVSFSETNDSNPFQLPEVGDLVEVVDKSGRKITGRFISYNPDSVSPVLTMTEKAWQLWLGGSYELNCLTAISFYEEPKVVEISLKDIKAQLAKQYGVSIEQIEIK